jgi:hypothetical protein
MGEIRKSSEEAMAVSIGYGHGKYLRLGKPSRRMWDVVGTERRAGALYRTDAEVKVEVSQSEVRAGSRNYWQK